MTAAPRKPLREERAVREVAKDIYALVAKSKRKKLEALLKELSRALTRDLFAEEGDDE